ncbi:hypothetical protein Fot_42330 [Forsythia ovata]|uniref:Uncharacterized protein n=1 Tax=Forsythia ovata TaxID=205694 RepID=A0ABD1RMN6_9LAMI
MRSWSANESPKNQNIGKRTSEKVVRTCSSKKLKEPHVPEPRIDGWERVPKHTNIHDFLEGILDKRDGDEECKSIDLNNFSNADFGCDPCHHESNCDPLDDKFLHKQSDETGTSDH